MSPRRERQTAVDDGSAKTARRGPRGQHNTPGPPGLIGTGEKAKNFKGSFMRLMRTLRPERTLIIVVILLTIVSVACQVARPQDHGRGHQRHLRGLHEPADQQAVESRGLAPDSWTKEQVVAQLEAAGRDRQGEDAGRDGSASWQGRGFRRREQGAPDRCRDLRAQRASLVAAGAISWPASCSTRSTGCGVTSTRRSHVSRSSTSTATLAATSSAG